MGAANRTLVIACDVLKNQIESLGEVHYDFIYLEQGLHRTPKMLAEQLQKTIDESCGYSVLLLGYGLCSRAVIGLRAAPHQKMIIPRIDDCIGISMGSRAKYYREFHQNPGTYYFTRGWIEAAEDPLKEYHRSVDKYGEDTALWAAWECMKNYQRTVLIRTSGQVHEPSKQYVTEFARFFKLQYEEMNGGFDYLKKLLFGPWDEDFVVIDGDIPADDEMFKD
ncbi:MAG: DUF1638 domain-containing protein [Clostridia bacterium]|nr:DUF1638 domain-containing protein [Clostridia bacterium]